MMHPYSYGADAKSHSGSGIIRNVSTRLQIHAILN